MRAGAISGALFFLVAAVSAAAHGASEAESHILSAFTSGADAGVLARDVRLGPKLRAELGRADAAKIYDALVDRTTGNLIRVNPLSTEEAARHAALVGGSSDPLLTLESGGLTLLLQYAPARRQVSFVEQIGVPPPPLKPAPEPQQPQQVEAPQLPPQPPKPAVLVEKPLPSALPPTPPAPMTAEKPRRAAPTPLQAPKPVEPKMAEKPRPPGPVAVQPEKPRGECVIKPVMSDEDLYNCGARIGK